jgi:hypothetical protein
MPKIADCLADDAVRCEPLSGAKFPVKQGKYREFLTFVAVPRQWLAEKAGKHWAFLENSLEIIIGNF